MVKNYSSLHIVYKKIKREIIRRINEFNKNRKKEERIFSELVFCILTPQSKARVCWSAVENLSKNGLLFKGDKNTIINYLKGIRFKRKKAKYILEARKIFIEKNFLKTKLKNENPEKIREWLVKNLKGIGYKEASHFLRNIGLGKRFAILDRHILKSLKFFGLIKKIPKNLSKKEYLKIEKKMLEFSKKINIPIEHLDFVLWYRETGGIFK